MPTFTGLDWSPKQFLEVFCDFSDYFKKKMAWYVLPALYAAGLHIRPTTDGRRRCAAVAVKKN
jgi:hypothetical protein